MTLENVVIGILVMITMGGVDYCNVQHTRCLLNGRAVMSSLWSVAQWTCASVGFVVAVKLSIYYLPFEALGLALGTYIGAKTFKVHDLQRRDQNEVPGMPAYYSGGQEPPDKRITGFTPPLSRGD